MGRGSYYSIEAILADEEPVPAVFLAPGAGLGYLDPGCDQQDILPGQKVTLPYWLAHVLAQSAFVTVSLPRFFNPRARSALQADATVVGLHDKSPYYYDLGMRLAALLGLPDLARLMATAFAQRYRMILDRSQNSRDVDLTPFTRRLCAVERRLFTAGHDAALAYDAWKNRRAVKLQSSQFAASRLKRRRLS